MSTVSIWLDDNVKDELDEMCAEMGMDTDTFYMIYTKKALRDRCIPFVIEAQSDPFHYDFNKKQMKQSDE